MKQTEIAGYCVVINNKDGAQVMGVSNLEVSRHPVPNMANAFAFKFVLPDGGTLELMHYNQVSRTSALVSVLLSKLRVFSQIRSAFRRPSQPVSTSVDD